MVVVILRRRVELGSVGNLQERAGLKLSGEIKEEEGVWAPQ